MKKILFTLLVTLGAVVAKADDATYSYLTFATADGDITSLEIGNGLSLSFTDGQLSVGNQTFSLTDLSTMFFAKEANAVTIDVGELGWATYCSSLPLDYTSVSGLTAYQAKFNDTTGKVAISELTNAVPSLTGVLLQGAEGSYNVPIASATTTPTANDLTGTTAMVTCTGNCYALAQVSASEVGFCLVSSGVAIPANKAYYAAASASRANYVISTETTAIETLETATADDDSTDAPYYDLQGRRVDHPRKGIYIKGGRKVIVR